MHEWQSLSHVRWDCKYHVVYIPKYRQKVIFGRDDERSVESLVSCVNKEGWNC